MTDEKEMRINGDFEKFTVTKKGITVTVSFTRTEANMQALATLDEGRGIALIGYECPKIDQMELPDGEETKEGEFRCDKCKKVVLEANIHYEEDTDTQLCYDCLTSDEADADTKPA